MEALIVELDGIVKGFGRAIMEIRSARCQSAQDRAFGLSHICTFSGDYGPCRIGGAHLRSDRQLAEAHTSLALVAQNYDWDWQTAEREYRRAIELDPNYATAHHWYAEFLSYLGRFDEAEAEIERARKLDPLSLVIATDDAVILYYARQYDRSIARFREVLAKDPAFSRAHMVELPYVEKGLFVEALADAASLQRETDSPWTVANLVYIHGRAGERKMALLENDRLKRLTRGHHFDPAAQIYAAIGIGDKELAFQELEEGYVVHSNALTQLKVDPAYDALRGDPRYEDLMRRVGLSN